MIHLTTVITELSSSELSANLVDEEEGELDGGILTAIRASLYDFRTGVTINNRKEIDVNGVNGGSCDSNGLFTWVLESDDNVIVGVERQETHAIMLEWEWMDTGNAKRKNEVFLFVVENLARLP